MPVGAATVRACGTADAFSQPSGNVDFDGELDFKVGNGLFRKVWVPSLFPTLTSDGLGPLLNARSCQGCHVKDRRGPPPDGLENDSGALLLRVSGPGGPEGGITEIAAYPAIRPDPIHGFRLHTASVAGQAAKARRQISYEELAVPFSDVEMATFRRPIYRLESLAYKPLRPDALLSLRIAPRIIGLGLLEAVPAADIIAIEDENDSDGGISGRANAVISAKFGTPMLDRFGLNAGAATIREHMSTAFLDDVGLSTSLHAASFGECTAAQQACRTAPDGADPVRDGLEADDEALDLVALYARNLAIPARRDEGDPDVLRGERIFHESGCTSCHHPAFVAHRLEDRPEQSFQLICAYANMLFHDRAKGWRITDPRDAAPATNGARLRSGASALRNR